MQTIVISARITTLCGSHTSPVVFTCKTAWLASELLVSMGPSTYLWFVHAKQILLDQNYKSLWVPDLTCHFVQVKQRDYHQNYLCLWVPALICSFCMQTGTFVSESQVPTCPRPHLSLCACKTECLASELLVSMGPSLHLWFLHAKQNLLEQNYKSL